MTSVCVDSKQDPFHKDYIYSDASLTDFTRSIVSSPLFQAAMRKKDIRIIAPASGMSNEILHQLRIVAEICSGSGIRIHIPENLLSNDIVFHASSDEERFIQLKEALYAESDNTVIWTLRGGYGCARLLDRLNSLLKPEHEKIFIGFSDNTALHLFLSQKWQWKTIHGAGFAKVIDQAQDPNNYLKIANIMSDDDEPDVQGLSALYPLNCPAKNIDGSDHACASVLTGGNLTLVENSIGTCWEMQASEKIVFLEEVGERGYRVDRSLYHLRQAGLFDGAKAVILGQFVTEKDDPTIDLALSRFANEMIIPVLKTNEFGHGDVNYPLRYNVTYEILPALRATQGFEQNVFMLQVKSSI